MLFTDFGMMGEMQQNLRDSLIEACLHLVNRDFEALAEDFVALGYGFIHYWSTQFSFLWLFVGLV